MLDEIFNGGAVDSSNQSFVLLLMSLAASDNVSQVKLGRITEQSIAMMRHIKKFCNVQFKIAECEDDIIGDNSDSESEDSYEENKNSDDEASASDKEEKNTTDKPTEFPKSFIFSCIGIGLTNIARKTE